MKISEFDYELPPELIAQEPAPRRDESRLMVVRRGEHSILHKRFCDLPECLPPGALLVLNNSRVFPARLQACREGGGRQLEILLLRDLEADLWEALLRPSRQAPVGTRLLVKEGVLEGQIERDVGEGKKWIRFWAKGGVRERIKELGRPPLPPYIRRSFDGNWQRDRERYQTVFAREEGSVAAPTAGLHFTPHLLERLDHVEITLHVGYGTFKPVRVQEVEQHRVDQEYYRISAEAAERIEEQRRRGRPIVAVGTTTTRVLESTFLRWGRIRRDEGWTDLYIYPGFRFQVIGGLITNFHLPRSSLLLLVAAFAGWDNVCRWYQEAIRRRYRFYSYGDSQLIL